MGQADIQVIDLNNERQVAEIKAFLLSLEHAFEGNVDYTVALYQNEQIVGTGSFAGKVLRNIAVLPQYQGEGYNAIIISSLIQELSRRGVFHYFIFTNRIRECCSRDWDSAKLLLQNRTPPCSKRELVR